MGTGGWSKATNAPSAGFPSTAGSPLGGGAEEGGSLLVSFPIAFTFRLGLSSVGGSHWTGLNTPLSVGFVVGRSEGGMTGGGGRSVGGTGMTWIAVLYQVGCVSTERAWSQRTPPRTARCPTPEIANARLKNRRAFARISGAPIGIQLGGGTVAAVMARRPFLSRLRPAARRRREFYARGVKRSRSGSPSALPPTRPPACCC